MEYAQELDKIKKEVTNSGKKLEDLAISIKELSGMTKIQDFSNNFNDDNVLNRIENKIDSLNSLNELLNSLSDSIKSKLDENCSSTSELKTFYEKMNGLSRTIDEIKANVEVNTDNNELDLVKSKINYISTKVNEYILPIKETINNKALPESKKVQNSLETILEKLKDNSNFYDSSLADLNFLKENFYRINEKFTEMNLLIKTNSGESEELNNRFESNLTNFNSFLQNIYKQFNSIETSFNNNFKDFKVSIQDVYDQFNTIDIRTDLDQVKLYVQSFNNKITTIADVLDKLKENGFAINIDKIDSLEQKIDLLAEFDPCELINIFLDSSKKSLEDINALKNSIEKSVKVFDGTVIKNEFQEIQNKIEFLNSNIFTLLDRFDNDSSEIRSLSGKIFDESCIIKQEIYSLKEMNGNNTGVNERLDAILNETQGFSSKMSDEFSSLVAPLSSAIELTCGLKDSIDEILSQDQTKIQQEAGQLLNRMENIYKTAEEGFESIFDASKQFYKKIEELKNEFSNLSYDTNSKINDFISKTDVIELKIQNNLSNSENTLNALKNISAFAENQINLTSESLNSLQTNVAKLYEEFGTFKNDFTEISSKLNKIILSEEEKAELLDSSFAGIKEEINQNTETITKNLNVTGETVTKNILTEFDVLNKKIDNTSDVSLNILKTSDDLKNALTCMAEWFDTAGNLIKENNKNLKNISMEKIDSSLKKTEDNVNDNLKRISEKLTKLEIRMESFEGKVERLQDQYNNRDDSYLLKELLEKNDLILNKMSMLESKIVAVESKKYKKID